jgi:hypothetical protein
MMRHSEERSDEESLFLLVLTQERFLASLGMTALGPFSTTYKNLVPRVCADPIPV